MDIIQQHKKQLEPGKPQLNFCDPAVMVIGFYDCCVNDCTLWFKKTRQLWRTITTTQFSQF